MRLGDLSTALLIIVVSASVLFRRIRGYRFVIKAAAASFEPAPLEVDAAAHGERQTLHVIGDTHGDANFLVRSLLSTELFQLERKKGVMRLKWREDLPEGSQFQVVILGDIIDRGTLSYENLLMLKVLSEAKPWGDRLKVMLGNHEGMLLEHDLKYADKERGNATRPSWSQGWTERLRHEALTAEDGYSRDLITWLCGLPVVHVWNGVLLTHGGLASRVLEETLLNENALPDDNAWSSNTEKAAWLARTAGRLALQFASNHTSLPDRVGQEKADSALKWARVSWLRDACKKKGKECGESLANYMNGESAAYHKMLHSCIRRPSDFGASEPFRCVHKVQQPEFLNLMDGVLWYRRQSSIEMGAGGEKNCAEVANMGETLGLSAIVLAHETHPFITQICKNNVPVFLVDTHSEDCVENGECDFAIEKGYHAESIEQGRRNVPQSLRLELADGHFDAHACLSRVGPQHSGDQLANIETKCFVPALA